MNVTKMENGKWKKLRLFTPDATDDDDDNANDEE